MKKQKYLKNTAQVPLQMTLFEGKSETAQSVPQKTVQQR
jgi:hypothetical protein